MQCIDKMLPYSTFIILAQLDDASPHPSTFVQDTIAYQEVCKFCAMVGREESGKEDMVYCEICEVWLHCSCVGIARSRLESIPFYCCQPPVTDELNFL